MLSDEANRSTQITLRVVVPPAPKTIPPRWDAMVEVEPHLANIERQARACFRRRRWVAYSTAKVELERLVGWNAKDPRLGSSAHYEAAVDHIVRVLGV